jgi:RNA polymerase sigma factor (sigma-70 family)
MLQALLRRDGQVDSDRRISAGALVALLRRAVIAHDVPLTEELFVSLLERSEASNRRWAARVVAHTPSLRATPQLRASVREDLKQELALYLWQRLARERDVAWELYFARALAFAQRRIARAYMEPNGYWPASGASQHPERLPALLLSRLADSGVDDATAQEGRLTRPGHAPDDEELLTPADLADLRGLVGRLPERERLAVVMRFWLGARAHEVASALGVTTRTVRNLLARAYARLRRDYTGS